MRYLHYSHSVPPATAGVFASPSLFSRETVRIGSIQPLTGSVVDEVAAQAGLSASTGQRGRRH
jgi:hypothetical protein